MLTSSQMYHYATDRTLCPLEYFLNNGWPSYTDLSSINDRIQDWPQPTAKASGEPRTHRAKAKASSSSSVTTPLSRASARGQVPPSTVERASKKARKAGGGRKKRSSSTALDIAANGMRLPDLFLVMYTSMLSSDGGMFQNKPDFNATFQTYRDDEDVGPVEVDASLDAQRFAERVGITEEEASEDEENQEDEDDEDKDAED